MAVASLGKVVGPQGPPGVIQSITAGENVTVTGTPADLVISVLNPGIGDMEKAAYDPLDKVSTAGGIEEFISLFVPPGLTSSYSGPTAPAGWLLCDGQAVSRTTYAKLFAVISTIYGPGDGTTTFNVPDMRDRVPLGSNANLGVKGGSDTHTLTAAQLPRTYLNIAYGRISNVGNGGFAIVAKDGMTTSYVDALGSGQAHSIRSKYIALNYIIKT